MEISLSSAVSIGVGIYTFFSSKSTPFNDVEYNTRYTSIQAVAAVPDNKKRGGTGILAAINNTSYRQHITYIIQVYNTYTKTTKKQIARLQLTATSRKIIIFQ